MSVTYDKSPIVIAQALIRSGRAAEKRTDECVCVSQRDIRGKRERAPGFPALWTQRFHHAVALRTSKTVPTRAIIDRDIAQLYNRWTGDVAPASVGGATIQPIGTVTSASDWVQPLPKVELHIHLEGAIRPATVCELSRERPPGAGVVLQDGWQHTYYTFTDFSGFMSQLTPRVPWRPDEYARIARECFEDQAALNVVYLEPSLDLPVREVGDDSRFWPIMESLEDERKRAEALYPMRINYIAGLMRTLPPEVGRYRVELAAEARDRGLGIVGIDLHGDELIGAAHDFKSSYELARERGLGLRAHAGEALGPESVWEVIDILGTHRIAHGVRAIEDPLLLERLKSGDITLELCLTSNVRTAAVSTIEAHPIRWLYDQGVPVTVSSDDPLPFFTDVEREYRLLVETFGFDVEDLRQINLYAARAAFLSEAERTSLISRIDKGYDAAQRRMSETA